MRSVGINYFCISLIIVSKLMLPFVSAFRAGSSNRGFVVNIHSKFWPARLQRSFRHVSNEHDIPDGTPMNAPSMHQFKSPFLREFQERGYLNQCTDAFHVDSLMKQENSVSAYLGFDATASSLHIGSLVQIMILRLLQKHGHKPVVLLGGGTTRIGDPSGKDKSRSMLESDVILSNIKSIEKIFHKFLDFDSARPNAAIVVNNADWLSNINYIDFLRDYGKYFSVNRMLTLDSIKNRLEREDSLSFLEFNYMILQAYDFLELNKRYGTTLQIGGSDQWGNIVTGIELARKSKQTQLYGLTAPLMTTSDGVKMGKSESGAVWLDK